MRVVIFGLLIFLLAGIFGGMAYMDNTTQARSQVLIAESRRADQAQGQALAQQQTRFELELAEAEAISGAKVAYWSALYQAGTYATAFLLATASMALGLLLMGLALALVLRQLTMARTIPFDPQTGLPLPVLDGLFRPSHLALPHLGAVLSLSEPTKANPLQIAGSTQVQASHTIARQGVQDVNPALLYVEGGE